MRETARVRVMGRITERGSERGRERVKLRDNHVGKVSERRRKGGREGGTDRDIEREEEESAPSFHTVCNATGLEEFYMFKKREGGCSETKG